MEKNAERRQTLTAVMAKGYLDPALFTQESNNLTAEENALTAEKERLSKTVDGNYRKTEELIKLVEYAKHSCPTPSFVSEPVEKFLEIATVVSRTEITFHLKCGLNLTERM